MPKVGNPLQHVKKMTPVDRLVYWIKEREACRYGKETLRTPPWTLDPILQQYRFCNVHREHDKVTRWIADMWRKPFETHSHLWFAMVFARLFNLPSTLERVGIEYVLCFDTLWIEGRLRDIQDEGKCVFNGAYIVSTNGKKMDKVSYLLRCVLEPMWKGRFCIQPKANDTLEAFHKRLTEYDGMGSFMAAQVVADMKYTPQLLRATDWYTFAASGPGSRRGLNRIFGRPVKQSWKEAEWRRELNNLRQTVNIKLGWNGDKELHGQDLQNCLCEYDKYCRTLFGEGKPKQRYPGLGYDVL